MTSRFNLTMEEEDAMRMEAGYPVKTFAPGVMLPLSMVKSKRIRPGTAPARGRTGTLSATRADRTSRAYDKMVTQLDRTGRLYRPSLAMHDTGLLGGDTARPAAPPMTLDPSPEAQAVRAAWATTMRYRSEYHNSYGPGMEPPALLTADAATLHSAAPQPAMRAMSAGSAGPRRGPARPPCHMPTRPNPANRHSQHCAVYNPAHHVSPNEAAGRFTGRVGADTYTTMRGTGRPFASMYVTAYSGGGGGGGGGYDASGGGGGGGGYDASGDGAARPLSASAALAANRRATPEAHAPSSPGSGGAALEPYVPPDVITDKDLSATAPWQRIGAHVVAGAPGVKLVGGRHRAVPAPAAEAREGSDRGREYVDFYGPLGGGGDPRVYYGRTYKPEAY